MGFDRVRELMQRLRKLNLQAKISLVLVAVILPTFLIVTIAQNQLTQPLIEEEMRQIGVTSARTLATEIVNQKLLWLPNPTPAIENRLQELLYLQPNILRMDVLLKDVATGGVKLVASNIEEDDPTVNVYPAPYPLSDHSVSERHVEDVGEKTWDIYVPIEQRSRDIKAPKKVLGVIHTVVSLKLVNRIADTLWRSTVSAAAFSVVLLILVLSYFLRKTIANDRKLREAESQNLQLTERLHEAQRQLMNTEKLAVMGQLTASFAHEIGTPLNAIGGHLQLLREDVSAPSKPEVAERMDIIAGQLKKIEGIVKGFLQSTAKPASQRQLVDLNRLADQTLGIVRPRIEALGIEVRRNFDREMGPLRAVPVDLEQVLLNLVNNSLDSLREKSRVGKGRQSLEISTRRLQEEGRHWAVVSVYDTGQGIRKLDIQNVFKPFFTTKRPGEGTGLGLTICQQLARKYGGVLEIDSKEGSWTKVTLKIPYQVSA